MGLLGPDLALMSWIDEKGKKVWFFRSNASAVVKIVRRRHSFWAVLVAVCTSRRGGENTQSAQAGVVVF